MQSHPLVWCSFTVMELNQELVTHLQGECHYIGGGKHYQIDVQFGYKWHHWSAEHSNLQLCDNLELK